MTAIPTVTLYRGKSHTICNVSDAERFLAQGWSETRPAPAPVPEPEVNPEAAPAAATVVVEPAPTPAVAAPAKGNNSKKNRKA